MPSGVVKWFEREQGRGVITRNGDGEITAQSPAVRDSANRGLLAGQQVCFDVDRDADGHRAENISRPTPGCCEPTASRQAEPPMWPVPSIPGNDAEDTCPWCIRMQEADTTKQ
ncbi:cold-shock protein [Streptomyces sp. NPDC055966]|uniref:cold-shock protein n=1 Tax=Streptomyces sp. NPDC055966 TaxID=3345669 RepID=UPI0035DFB4A1